MNPIEPLGAGRNLRPGAGGASAPPIWTKPCESRTTPTTRSPAGIFSRSPAHLDRAARELLAGNVYLNRPITGALVNRQPFGGFKLSGIGDKAGGPDYLLQFVVERTVTENTLAPRLRPASGGRGIAERAALYEVARFIEREKMSERTKRIAKKLAATIVDRFPETGGGAFGAARLVALRSRLRPKVGLRPGRPTDSSWNLRRKIPLMPARCANWNSWPPRPAMRTAKSALCK